jgi:hypothetical protein
MLFLLISIASAVNYYQTTTGGILGQANPNSRDVCISIDAPGTCLGLDSSTIFTSPSAGFSAGTCANAPTSYPVACSTDGFSGPIPTCGTLSFNVNAKTDVDCDLFDTDTTATTQYRFMSDSAWGESTGISADFCTNALLPDSCAGQDMTSTYVDTLGAVAGTCDQSYTVTCSGVGNSNVINTIGICGSATIDVKFKSQSDCDAATSNASGAQAAAQTAAEAAGGCVEADTFGNTDFSCAQAAQTLGCSQAAVMMACRAACNVGDCGSASALTIALAALSAIIFTF